MAIIDWPTSRPFQGAQFSLGLDVSESGFTGFLTGNRTRRSNLADRLRGTLVVPPTFDRVSGAQREAFMLGWRSTGDWLRMGMPHRAVVQGTLRGSPVLSASAAAGARSISVSGALSGANLLTSSGFEVDTNGDGVADGWTAWATGSTGTVTRYTFPGPLIAGESGVRLQAVQASALNGGVGYLSQMVPVVSSVVYCASAAMETTALFAHIAIIWLDSGGAYISESNANQSGTRARWSSVGVAPVGAAYAQVLLYASAPDSPAMVLNVDNAQFQAATIASEYAGPATLAAGDWLAVGGNLLHVAYPGATLNDAGAGSIPLTLPLQKPLASGAPVTWSAPTGLWELDDDGLQLDYSAGVLQSGFAIPLRQVIA